MDRLLKMVYGAPTLKAQRYFAATDMRRAVHRVLAYDAVLGLTTAPRERAALRRWRRRAVRQRGDARRKYRRARAAWDRATPEQRGRGGLADDVLRPSPFAKFMEERSTRKWHVNQN
jgi:hypothetical protein